MIAKMEKVGNKTPLFSIFLPDVHARVHLTLDKEQK